MRCSPQLLWYDLLFPGFWCWNDRLLHRTCTKRRKMKETHGTSANHRSIQHHTTISVHIFGLIQTRTISCSCKSERADSVLSMLERSTLGTWPSPSVSSMMCPNRANPPSAALPSSFTAPDAFENSSSCCHVALRHHTAKHAINSFLKAEFRCVSKYSKISQASTAFINVLKFRIVR